jgi:hypothetical protein
MIATIATFKIEKEEIKMTDKERLEEIKKHLNNTFIKLGRSTGKVQLINDLNWLIQQAEIVQRYEKYIDYYVGGEKLTDIKLAMTLGMLDDEERLI